MSLRRGVVAMAAWGLAIALLAFATAGAAAQQPLTVFAAASLQDVLKEIGPAFEAANPGTRVTFHFAGTSALRAQLEHGAPADVFAGADTVHADALARAGHLGAPRTFARNRLVLVTRPDLIVPDPALDQAATLRQGFSGAPGLGDSPAGARAAVAAPPGQGRAREALLTLARPGTRVVLADEAVPAGRYAREALIRMTADPQLGRGFRGLVERNVRSRETSVRAALARVALGEADASIVYATDVRPDDRRVRAYAIPDAWNVRTRYVAATVRRSKNQRLARAFVAFLESSSARAAFARYGFEQ